MKILVTGGLGYIGSHVVVELLENQYDVHIVDDLSNSSLEVLDGIVAITGKQPDFTKLDLRDQVAVAKFFSDPDHRFDGVIHFAAFKAVGESVEKPLAYYENNVGALVRLLQHLGDDRELAFIFSSSCTVYGQADKLPVSEIAPTKPAESPYGNTKQIGEEILYDYTNSANHVKAIALRYFNPIGAHESALIGELPLGVPQNLVPFITQTAMGMRKELSVFGDDYPTVDGTAVRDYIHVVDLAKAHVAALERVLGVAESSAFEVFNIGTGTGSSVMQVITAFENATGVKLPYKIAARRPGDVVAAYAETKKASQVLGWKAQFTLEESLASAWKWEQAVRRKLTVS